MDREIKFRGINIHNGEWVYGNLLSERAIGRWGNSSHYEYSEVKPETVGQFTGLKDKNGVDIYFGDIIRTEHKEFDEFGDLNCEYIKEGYIREGNKYLTGIFLQWNRGNMRIKNFLQIQRMNGEIIGNIHNPHKKP